jgi:hypothetical protein
VCSIINTLMTPGLSAPPAVGPGIDPAEAWRFRAAEPVVIAPPEVPAAELASPVNAAPPPAKPWTGWLGIAESAG